MSSISQWEYMLDLVSTDSLQDQISQARQKIEDSFMVLILRELCGPHGRIDLREFKKRRDVIAHANAKIVPAPAMYGRPKVPSYEKRREAFFRKKFKNDF